MKKRVRKRQREGEREGVCACWAPRSSTAGEITDGVTDIRMPSNSRKTMGDPEVTAQSTAHSLGVGGMIEKEEIKKEKRGGRK